MFVVYFNCFVHQGGGEVQRKMLQYVMGWA